MLRKHLAVLTLLASPTILLAQGQAPASSSQFDGTSWWAHVKVLADDSLEGRDTGSEGLRKAQAYAVQQLQKAGLEPAGTNGFYQPVSFNQFTVDESKSSLALIGKDSTQRLSFANDAYISTRLTRNSSQVKAPLVFIGYGLKVPENNLDEIAGLDVKGKVVVYIAGSPSDIPTSLAAHYQTLAERWKTCAMRGPSVSSLSTILRRWIFRGRASRSIAIIHPWTWRIRSSTKPKA